jgi:arabinogalactan endo-1,4-beta-galactosidase
MKKIYNPVILLMLFTVFNSCSDQLPAEQTAAFMYGGDFSILKKMVDSGGVYKIDGVEKNALEIFTGNGYNYARLRIFHTPNMAGPTCNSLEYTIALAKEVKAAGMKILLNFHYSDTWADPGHQIKPQAWEGLAFEVLVDSVYQYSKSVIRSMKNANVLPDMVQIGNEVSPGMIWPEGKIEKDSLSDWDSFSTLLKAGISGVKDAYGSIEVPIMIHTDKSGDVNATGNFFTKIAEHGVIFDLIGLSYYP